ncbi:MAG TPA: family 78 glycoside hydrolase catalytic domain, partial [Fimbriimonas sp.]|nr:family 78 glycoside hydrolase catalytic domain [Fimbriimonas sp.]
IQLRHAERLNPDGTIYTTNLRTADSNDTYICADDKPVKWHPTFTFHGFQYVEVTGVSSKPNLNMIEGIALSSDTPVVGNLTTSDGMLNKLVQNAYWTQRMNFIDVPTDCPQRDERLGWTGDAQAFIRTACTVTDSQAFFNKWLVDLDDGQRADGQYPMVAPVKVAGDDGGPAWADAGVICPWTSYQMYGDKTMLMRHYPNMKEFVEFCIKRSGDTRMPPAQFHCFGDWLSINANTPNEVIYVAYFAYSSHLLSLAAAELGKTDDAAYYSKVSSDVKAAFVKNFVGPDGKVKGETQCGYVLALAFDLVPADMRNKLADLLVADIEKRGSTLSTGFVGTRDIMNALSSVGRQDIALKLLHQTTFPSWGFSIVNGATSIWERWDGWTPEKGFQDPGMNSFAHYAFGAVVGWMYKELGGIDNTAPAFADISIKPLFDPKLDFVNASYDSIQGPITVNWKRANGEIDVTVEIPPNTTALVDTGKVKQRIGSGRYTFKG